MHEHHEELPQGQDKQAEGEPKKARRRLRRKGHGGGGHNEMPHIDEKWLVSYSDMMTLLFGLFVMLYSIAMETQGSAGKMNAKLKQLAKIVNKDAAQTPDAPETPEDVTDPMDPNAPLDPLAVENYQLKQQNKKIQAETVAQIKEIIQKEAEKDKLREKIKELEVQKEQLAQKAAEAEEELKETEEREEREDRQERIAKASPAQPVSTAKALQQMKALRNPQAMKIAQQLAQKAEKLAQEKKQLEQKLAQIQKDPKTPAPIAAAAAAALAATRSPAATPTTTPSTAAASMEDALSSKSWSALIIANWTSPGHDIDLEVRSPKGNWFNFKHQKFDRDENAFVQDAEDGPGSEVFKAFVQENGNYEAKVKLYNYPEGATSSQVDIKVILPTGEKTVKTITLTPEHREETLKLNLRQLIYEDKPGSTTSPGGAPSK